MKSSVKLIKNLGIKLASIALLSAFVMGLCSCKGCSAAEVSSDTTNTQELIESEESLGANPGATSIPSKSLQTSGTNPDSNIENKNTDVTRNEDVSNPTEQTKQDTSDTGSVNNQEENNSDSAPTTTTEAADVSGQSATPTPIPTSTPKPTATPTPKPTNTPVPTATPTPEPTATPTPEPTEAPKPAVAAYVQATFIVYGATDDDNPTYVESTVVRTYKVQPKDGCSYHSPHVSNYVCIDAQISWSDLDNAFLKEHPGCVVHGYDTVDEQVVGFVDD